ncbi:MAG: YfhO family protein [Isosphaeraceae bacterium]
MDGFYPYHEMNAYLGLLGLMLAVLGGGGPVRRDRWVVFWILLAAVGGVLMLGKFTLVFDYAHRIPVLGSSREPVRFHLWVTFAVAALAATGVERLARPGAVRIRPSLALAASLILASIPILTYVYGPVWTDPGRWHQPYHIDRFRWLGEELRTAIARNLAIVGLGSVIAWTVQRLGSIRWRASLAWIFPALVLADLALTAAHEVPTVSSAYWTTPPETVLKLKADSTFIRVFGDGDRHSGEPGYASEPIDYLLARDALDWSLPAAWGIASAKGETPMIPRRLLDYFDHAKIGGGRYDVESVSHVVIGRDFRKLFQPNEPVGAAFLHRNPNVLPRARLVGRPVYVEDPRGAVAAIDRLGPECRTRLIVEDPTRPLPESADVDGAARFIEDLPEHVVVETESAGSSYLLLADTFDPGWSATLDGKPAPIRPAYAAFRAVALPPGRHTVAFSYQPAGFMLGLAITGVGVLLGLILLVAPPIRPSAEAVPSTVDPADRLRRRLVWAFVLLVLLSLFRVERGPRLRGHERWHNTFHRFTWGAGLEAMREHRQ